MSHSIKSIRRQFKDRGVFYTSPRLAELLKSFMPENIADVYDPTCGDGALLSVFSDDVMKYGQEIDSEQAEVARQRLCNNCIITGDTLGELAFEPGSFRAIVANPPFSIPWDDAAHKTDVRFTDAPVLPPKARADYAFLLHVIYMLADNGVAAVLNFPGILYRGNREGKIRQWIVERNLIAEVMQIEGGYFEDTTISTALLIIKKNKTSTDIKFTDHALGISRTVPIDEVKANGFNLSVSSYVQAPEPEKIPFDVHEKEMAARAHAIKTIKAEIEFSQMVAEFEGWSINDFIFDIITLASSYLKK